MSTGVDQFEVQPDPVSPTSSIAHRLADLLRSLDSYDLLSNGVRADIGAIVATNPESVAELDDDHVRALWFGVVNVMRERRLEPVLALHGLPHPRYPVGTVERTDAGPPAVVMWDAPQTSASPPGGWRVLGRDVGFPIGIPSCELTCNADWIEYYARKGFHVLTYRTVRSKATPGSAYDWVFLRDRDVIT